MEVVEPCEGKNRWLITPNQERRPVTQKCTKKYVQPPRVKPFVPGTVYCTPRTPIETNTTYHTSYIGDVEYREARPKPILPSHNINLPNDKFHQNTTNKMSFKPVLGINKAEPCMPRHRICPPKTPMASVTTISQDYIPKYTPKLDAIMPCGHIRTSTGKFETKTTTCLSYVNPGPTEMAMSCRPQLKYCRPTVPAAGETTQKLSFLPYEPAKKENYPWAMKPAYKSPEISMFADTTYKKSYFNQKSAKEKPILPRDGGIFPKDAQFFKNTIYKESYIPCRPEQIAPILPCPNITFSDKKMCCDTTNKMSFQTVKGQRRKPIVPRTRKILGDAGFVQNITTNRLAFTPKFEKRRELIVPCGHIRTSNQPFENKTTTILSYVNPGLTTQAQSCRPQLMYCKPQEKIQGETVNKLSYPQWTIGPKEEFPWARKLAYQRAKDKIASDSVYKTSFLPPGYFVEQCEPVSNNDCLNPQACDCVEESQSPPALVALDNSCMNPQNCDCVEQPPPPPPPLCAPVSVDNSSCLNPQNCDCV